MTAGDQVETMKLLLQASPEQWSTVRLILTGPGVGASVGDGLRMGGESTRLAPARTACAGEVGRSEAVSPGQRVVAVGRLEYRPGFKDVWLDDEAYDLRKWQKARLCLQYLVEREAFHAGSARHLMTEIDPYVREQSGFPPAPHSEVKIQHYFNDRGRLRALGRQIIQPSGRDGRYFLRVEQGPAVQPCST